MNLDFHSPTASKVVAMSTSSDVMGAIWMPFVRARAC